MPTPTAREIIAMRWRVRVALRGVAVLLLVAAMVIAALRIPTYNKEAAWAAAGYARPPELTSWTWFGVPLAAAAMAVALLLLARFAIAVLVPVPKPGCPGCGYDLSNPTSERCPECGLVIGALPPNDSA
ncbi:MAG: hypothetical protein AAFX79_08745 [Planctomycetota bacterium]